MATAIAVPPSTTLVPTAVAPSSRPSTPQTSPRPATYDTVDALRSFTVDDYDAMIRAGILDDRDKVELLEGHVVLKMARDPIHDGTIQLMIPLIYPICPKGWGIRVQSAIRLAQAASQPEPDFALVRGTGVDYMTRHPEAADVGLVIEVSNTSLVRDTVDKTRIYAAEGLPVYWVINLIDRRVEVYTVPVGGRYTQLRTYHPGESIPLTLDNSVVANVPVVQLLP